MIVRISDESERWEVGTGGANERDTQCFIKETGIPTYRQPRDLPNQKSSTSDFVKERTPLSSRARYLEPGSSREASEEVGSQCLN